LFLSIMVLDSVEPRGDYFLWAKQQNLFIDQDDLVDMMDNDPSRTLVVDVRDDDNGGGQVKGALHVPDGSFQEELPTLLEPLSSMADGSTIVFHCMESARRGPRCAKRMVVLLESRSTPDLPSNLKVRVLKGGADHWIRRFWRDPSKVQGFDPDYWSFGDDDNSSSSSIVPGHKTYTRPADQDAVDWATVPSSNSSGSSNTTTNNKRWEVVVLSAATLLVAVGLTVWQKKLAHLVPQHMFAVSFLATFLLTPGFFVLLWLDPATPAQQANAKKFPLARFLLMAVFDTLQMSLVMFASAKTPGQLQAILGKAAIPFSMLAKLLLLGVKPSLAQVVGCALIIAGAAAATGNVATLMSATSGQGDLWYYLLFLLSNLPAALGAVYKGVAMEDFDINDYYLNGWCTLFQCGLSLVLLPLNSLPLLGDDTVPLQEIGPRLLKCVLCVTGQSNESGCYTAGLNLLLWLVLLLVFNVLMMKLTKAAGATLMFAILTLKTPFTAIAFSSAVLMGQQAEALQAATLLGMCLILVGIVVFNNPFSSTLKKEKKE